MWREEPLPDSEGSQPPEVPTGMDSSTRDAGFQDIMSSITAATSTESQCSFSVVEEVERTTFSVLGTALSQGGLLDTVKTFGQASSALQGNRSLAQAMTDHKDTSQFLEQALWQRLVSASLTCQDTGSLPELLSVLGAALQNEKVELTFWEGPPYKVAVTLNRALAMEMVLDHRTGSFLTQEQWRALVTLARNSPSNSKMEKEAMMSLDTPSCSCTCSSLSGAVSEERFQALLSLVDFNWQEDRGPKESIALIPAARSLGMTTAASKLCSVVTEYLSVSNCLDVFKMASVLKLGELWDQTLYYILNNFSEICAQRGDQLPALSVDQLAGILSHKELVVDSESDVFEAIGTWTKIERQKRQPCVPRLFGHVRLLLCNPAALKTMHDHFLLFGLLQLQQEVMRVHDLLKSSDPEVAAMKEAAKRTRRA